MASPSVIDVPYNPENLMNVLYMP